MTSRCRASGLPSYTTKARAEKATTKNPALAGGRAYRCGCGSWHIEGGAHGDDTRKRQRATFNRVEWDEATMLLWARSHGLCEACGKPLGANLERHHRQRRAIGGDRLANLVALSTECHQWVHAHPEDARHRGLIVSSYATDPSALPLLLPDGRRVLLTDDGGLLAT